MKITIQYTRGKEVSFDIIEEKDYERVKKSYENQGYKIKVIENDSVKK